MKKIRRVVTGHDEQGLAVFKDDDHFEPLVIPTGDAAMATIWTTASVPVDCNDETDGRLRDAGTTLKGGAQPENSPYAASKHGVVGLTKTAAKEYATDNIRVNAVCPTAIETPMIMEGRRKLAHNAEARQAAIDFQAMKRMGTPQEIAEVILWLCSDQASFITGVALTADGGALA